ncbi:LpqB family beta-propeller domain-containing protein [Sphingomonas sp. IC-11]|uniref:S41 family peptidase n=1 Tax=Sphingomonas sp. IC-11 TaxID=2898528 RepID=UPI001E5EF654|nr:LpqB family beta-propeller domain-containing protein [Sphingomonas sp. IC-11]MCD2317601.1 LpqB family beta-propeller domain-containing protein [Sphingomonas sp. IC-11]
MIYRTLFLLASFALAAGPLWARPVRSTEPLARFPTASAEQIAFVAAGDLWIMPRSGGTARRLTQDPGQVLAPHFSPDGQAIAFTWRRAGKNDVYILPVSGGTPVRLTHGPSLAPYDNLVTGWTPDGKAVLFVSRRASPLGRYDIYSVPARGGLATALGLGHAGLASVSPDGTRIAFDRSYRTLGNHWKRYRGGQAGELFTWNMATQQTERLTTWEGIDTAPMWAGDRLFFLSDRGPEKRLNLWVLDLATKRARQLTHYADYDVDMPSAGPGGIAFAQQGRLHLLDPVSGQIRDLTVRLPAEPDEQSRDLPAARFVAREDIVNQADYALGSDGTAFLVARGDLFALGSDGGWENLTKTPGRAEDHPAVSPDGGRLAYVTDASGEQQVAVRVLGRTSAPRELTRFKSGVLYTPRWSPDGRHLTVADANKQLWLIAADGSRVERIAADPFAEIQDAVFSHDGRRLAYSVTRADQTRALHVRSISNGRDVELTAPDESDHDPAFTADDKELLFVSARREHPFVSDRDREGTIATIGSDGVYRATLSDDGDPALFHASTRPLDVSGTSGFTGLAVRGQTLFYRETPLAGIDGDLPGQTGGLRAVDLATGEDTLIGEAATSYTLAPDSASALIVQQGSFKVIAARPPHGGRALSLNALRVTVAPALERREMFEQAWRLDRDLFWDPAMNGVDWQAMHDRYSPLVARARSHEDMIYVLGELQGELSTSHMFLGGGDAGDPRTETIALLGVDFALDAASSRYRMANIYRGDNSRERFRAPLGDPALGVRDGDLLLAVDGEPLLAPDDPYRLLLGRQGTVRLTIAHNPDDPGRVITVKAIANEGEIRKLAWIERNRATVNRLSGGKTGYLYLSDFNDLGSQDFLRQYYSQTNKTALVIDVRDNRGGFTSQWVLDVLRRPQAGVFRNREGGVITLPGAVAPPRMVTLTSIFSASDGDQFPYFFRQWKMGPVVGQRTWGGVRGIKGPWHLIDGTYVTVPKDSLLTQVGEEILENRGAEPDLLVDDTPADILADRDRQLEQAVAIVAGN